MLLPIARYQKIETAPRDGTVVILQTRYGDVRARYVDCGWQNDGELAESITDCWRPVEPDNPFGDCDIGFKEALHWRPDRR